MRQKSLPLAVRTASAPARADSATVQPTGRRQFRDVVSVLVMLALVPTLMLPTLQALALGPALSVNGQVEPGATLSISGRGFEPNTKLVLSWDVTPAWQARSNQRGDLQTRINVPADAALGDHVVVASYATEPGKAKKDQVLATGSVASVTVTVAVTDTGAASPTASAGTPSAEPSTEPSAPPLSPSPPATASPTSSPTPAPTSTPPAGSSGDRAVATNGSDANPGTLALPWRTLQKAADSAAPGATVFVRGGAYAGFSMTRSGTAGESITFTGYPGETAVVAGTSSTVNVIRLAGVHDVVLRNLVVRGAAADKSGAGIRIDSGSYRVSVLGNLLHDNRSYGISIVDSTQVTIRGNEITGNAEGVYVLRAGSGVLISDNDVHHQDRMVVATVGGNDDHGGVGIAFVRTAGTVTATGNRIWGNRAVSPDYGYDGGAFEIYAASNVVMTGNTAWNNRNVIETGSDGTPCRNNVFSRNVAYGATTADVSKGMVLRCAENMLIANNTFYRLDEFVFDFKAGGNWGTSVAGLRVMNNVAVMAAGKIYGVDADVLSDVRVDHNLIWHEAGGTLGTVTGYGWTTSLATLRSWTGFDLHGMNAPPRFAESGILNLRLSSASAAVDRALLLPGVSDEFLGGGPDIGRYESY